MSKLGSLFDLVFHLNKSYIKIKFKPHVISWNLTKGCNLLCAHCYLPTNNTQATLGQYTPTPAPTQCTTNTTHEELNTKEAFNVIDDIAEINPNIILILTGGEPLLRRDIFDLSRRASGKGMMVLLGTNACLIDDKAAKRLKDSGVAGIGISVDSVYPDVHDSIRGTKGSWKKAIEGMRACKRHGLEIQIQTTEFKKNYNEI